MDYVSIAHEAESGIGHFELDLEDEWSEWLSINSLLG